MIDQFPLSDLSPATLPEGEWGDERGYWAGYCDGFNAKTQIDLWSLLGVALLVFLCGMITGIVWIE